MVHSIDCRRGFDSLEYFANLVRVACYQVCRRRLVSENCFANSVSIDRCQICRRDRLNLVLCPALSRVVETVRLEKHPY